MVARGGDDKEKDVVELPASVLRAAVESVMMVVTQA